MKRAIAMLLLPGCIVFGETDPYGQVDFEFDPDREGIEEELEFATYAFDLPGDRAHGWSIDATQRHLGGLIETEEGMVSATLTLTDSTGGELESLVTSTPWPGALVDSTRLWLDDQPMDWAAWRGEDADWLGLRGLVEFTVIDDLGAESVSAFTGDGEIVLTACGAAGLAVWRLDFAGELLDTHRLDTPGNRCAILASDGFPMVLHGDSSGGPMVRHQLTDAGLVEALTLHPDLPADGLAAASSGGNAMMALHYGGDVALWSGFGDNRLVSQAEFAEPLVVDVLSDGRAAVAWADELGVIHTGWGTISGGIETVSFTIEGPPAGLAVGLRDDIVSIAAFDGEGVVLARQRP